MVLYDFISAVVGDSGVCEKAVFAENYALLHNTITDIVDPLMKRFIEENLFTSEEQKQITDLTSKSDKMQMLLLKISSSLNDNNTKYFWMMLEIMREHSGKGIKSLAHHIINKLKRSADKSSNICINDTELHNDKPKS